MIVIEGSDCVGKTTLAKKIERRTGLLYQHLSRLPASFDRYHGYAGLMRRDVVRDRFHMSEPVYCAVREEPTSDWPLTPERYALVDARLRLLGAVVVVVTCDNTLLRGRHGGKDEMYSVEQVLLANELFREMATGAGETGVRYQPDCHYHLECDRRKPFPDDRDLAYVIALHERRQAMILGIEERRRNDGPLP